MKEKITVLLGDPSLPDAVKKDNKFNDEDFETIERLKNALSGLENMEFEYLDKHETLIEVLQNKKPNFVLNLCDEGFLNKAEQELHITALLEMLKIPYTGAPPACLAVCYNKSFVRALAYSLNIPVPFEMYYDPKKENILPGTTFPVFIKPNFGDSSVGITAESLVHTLEDMQSYVYKLNHSLHKVPLLLQEFLPGNEYSVGILGNKNNYTVLPILKVDYSKLGKHLPHILGYESKWLPDSEYWDTIAYQQANLDEKTANTLIHYATELFERTGCRDYARFDFRADSKGVIKFLEVNPNPGWCWDGKLNLMCDLAGISYPKMLSHIIASAKKRYLT